MCFKHTLANKFVDLAAFAEVQIVVPDKSQSRTIKIELCSNKARHKSALNDGQCQVFVPCGDMRELPVPPED